MDLRRAALSGFRWMAAVRVVGEVIAFASAIVLARLVPPQEYGRAIIALAFVVVITTLFQDGLATPLVQRDEVGEPHLRATALLALALGAGTALAVALVLPVVVRPAFGAQTASLVGLLWPVFLFEGLAVVPRAVLQRRLEFRTLGVIEVVGLLAATTTAMTLAARGAGATAIVVGSLVQGGLQAVLLSSRVRPPRPHWDRRATRELLGFGGPAALSSFVFQLWRNVDYALLGALLGARQAALYWRAYTLAMEHQGKISGIMLRLAFPLYSRTERPEQMLRLRGRIVRAHAMALFPLLVALIVLAPTLVPFLYGAAWADASLPTQLLAVAGFSAVVSTGTGPLLMACGHPRLLLAMNLANMLVYAGVVVALAPLGLTAVALGAVAFFLANFVAVHLVLERVVGLRFREVLADIAPAAVSGAAMLVTCLALAAVLREAGAPTLAELVGVPAAGGLVYAAVLRAVFHAAWRDMRLLATTLVRRRAAVA